MQSFSNILDAMARVENQPSPSSPQSSKRGPLLTPELLEIKSRLQPLADIEKNLIRRITMAGSGQVDPDFRHGMTDVHPSKDTLKEIAINSTIPWKNAFSRLLKSDHRSSFDSADAIDWDDPEDPWAILNQCSQDMIQLWNSPNIKQLLAKKMVRSEDLSE